MNARMKSAHAPLWTRTLSTDRHLAGIVDALQNKPQMTPQRLKKRQKTGTLSRGTLAGHSGIKTTETARQAATRAKP